MAKARETIFYCSECGTEFGKWSGFCSACKTPNTLVEAPKQEKTKVRGRATLSSLTEPVSLDNITSDKEQRIVSGFPELNRVLGGGFVKGSLVLVGGDPGIGKSTLLLQVCDDLVKREQKVLYISGEESLQQIKIRAKRLRVENHQDFLLFCETNLEVVEETIRKIMPSIVVIDSIQTMYSETATSTAGSVTQVRECTNHLLHIGKTLGITILLVGHVTKEGVVAGPRILEHMVDTVLYFEGDNNAMYRLLRSVKNRFGSTNEVGIFEMRDSGLAEVANPSEYMLMGRPHDASGSIVTCSGGGSRPLLLEIQALVATTNYGMTRRTIVGADPNRTNLILAVLEKKFGLGLSGCDIFVTITGGMKVNEPSLDLAIALAIVSSFYNRVFDDKTVVFGELGLAGEIRGVSLPLVRLKEIAKLGFKTCILPKASLEGLNVPESLRCIGVNKIDEVIGHIHPTM